MIILGLGSNLGDRLAYLRQALQLLKKLPKLSIRQVSPLYLSNALLPEQAPAAWDLPYLNLAIHCESQLAPLTLLQQLKNIEYIIGRKPAKKQWGPRAIDIDILAWDEAIIDNELLHIPHVALPERPFALWPLADLAPYWVYPLPGPYQGQTATQLSARWGSRFSGEAPLQTRQIMQRIDTPQLVGILNITPDSFSDGGQFNCVEKAIHHVYHLVSTGADIIDIGAEATNPNVLPVEPEDEWERLEPFLQAIQQELPYLLIPPKISIDTRHVDVAEKALKAGIDWINDTSGLQDKKMRALLASTHQACVVMHNLGIPADKNKILSLEKNPVDQVYAWAEQTLAALEKDGIKRNNIIFDVGLGFGKDAEQSFALIQHIQRFQGLNTRLLVGHSRKSFLQKFVQRPPQERDLETALLSHYFALQGIDYLRVHNVEASSRVFKLAQALPFSPLQSGKE